MLRPGKSLFIAALFALVFGFLAFFIDEMLFLWRIVIFFPLPFAIADAIVLYFLTNRMHIERQIDTSLVLGVAVKIKLKINLCEGKKNVSGGIIHRAGREICPSDFMIFDIFDSNFECDIFPAKVCFAAADGVAAQDIKGIVFCYEALPVERGNWTFVACELVLPSMLRFWRLRVRHNVVSHGKIYPDFRMLTDSTALRAVLERSGEKSFRKRGDGTEFDHLSDWQQGDSIRAVDWRATSRRGNIIVRRYVEEQDQQVVFLLDSGYRLHGQFDAALNATLFLAWSALKHGDAVGGALFGGEERWITPRRGISALSVIINGLCDAKSSYKPSSLSAALETALARLVRRSFLVLVSNFREEDEEPLSLVLRYAGTRHLLLLVNVHEPQVDLLARQMTKSSSLKDEDALIAQAAYSYCEVRRKLLTKWEARGFLTLDSNAAGLSAALINHYLKVKRSGRL